MLRSHTCGALRLHDQGKKVQLAGWVQRNRKLGGLIFIDLRDRYGMTQLVFDEHTDAQVRQIAESMGREWVVQVEGAVRERTSKNPQLATGEIEVSVQALKVLSAAQTPPFTVEAESDGGPELRAQYRYLDLRRSPLQAQLQFRAQLAHEVRRYLNDQSFLEIETPFLIKSTPEGARDFVVPSRLHPGQAYALPQSPQTFKQLLMLSGYDRYYQIVRCFRDEDLRADRQPEFTQVDCEMSFVDQDDVMEMFEGLLRRLLEQVCGADPGPFPRMTYRQAMEEYGTDKPDLRFGMAFFELTPMVQGHGFQVFDQAEWVGGICVPGAGHYSRKQLDALTEWVRRPQIGAQGLVYVKWDEQGRSKSSVDKFFSSDDLAAWKTLSSASDGDLLLILAGPRRATQSALSELRLEMGNRLELRHPQNFKPLWVTDFPLLEWDEETQRHYAMHHPFTAPHPDDLKHLHTHPSEVRAQAYDLVLNGVEIGGGSIRIHQEALQQDMFKLLGFTQEEAQEQFGFLIEAFRYGAPPHGGIALGFDRLCAVLYGKTSIRDFIAFPKNNAGRDVMLDAPAPLDGQQWRELALRPLVDVPSNDSETPSGDASPQTIDKSRKNE